VVPDIAGVRFVLRDGVWCNPDEQPYERWSADAAVDPIHAAIATRGAAAERAKSVADIEFLVERAVDGVVLDLDVAMDSSPSTCCQCDRSTATSELTGR
jgi:hypothetical protein